MRRIIFFMLPLFCFCTRQQNTNQNVIDLLEPVDEEITRLFEIATEVDYIPLQTNDSSLISRISDIRISGDFFYILSSAMLKSQILCFDNKGEFLYKLDKNGRGPEEYFLIGDFDINFDNSILAVYSGKEVIFYNRTDNGFTYKNRVPLRANPTSISFADGENDLMIMYPNAQGNDTISKELINLNGESIKQWPNYFMYVSKDNMVVNSMQRENLSYIYNNNLFLKELQSDTLFSFSDGQKLEPFIVFNTGDRRVTPDARSNGRYYSDHMDEYIIFQKVMESDGYVYYSYNSNPSQNFFYDKKTNAVFKVDSKTKLIDDLNGGVNFDPQYGKNGIFYSWIDALNLKKDFSVPDIKNLKNPEKYESLVKLIDTLNENDNPIIIMAKIK